MNGTFLGWASTVIVLGGVCLCLFFIIMTFRQSRRNSLSISKITVKLAEPEQAAVAKIEEAAEIAAARVISTAEQVAAAKAAKEEPNAD